MSSSGNATSSNNKKNSIKKRKKASTGLGSKKTSTKKKESGTKAQKSYESNVKEASAKIFQSEGVDDLMISDRNSSDEDYADDGDEGSDGYKPGGYHPVHIGDKFNSGRYTVIEKLGWGHFSTVWLCYDKKAKISNTPEFVALKIQKSAPHYREAALDEIELLKCVANTAFILQQSLNQNDAGKIGNQQNMKILYDPCVVMLYDHFDHVGQYGRHICMTFETLGENLYKVIQKYGYHGIPISITKNMIRQICIGLDFLHRHCNIIHTDLKPENILVAMEPKLPDPDYLNSLIKSNDTSNKIQLSKKSNGRKSSIGSHNNQSSPQNHNSSPSKQIQTFEIHENLTVEQKKKLKKKMKRKRQQARKNSTKKPTTTSRGSRNNGRRKSTRNKTATSLEKAMTEMRMMELDSIPLASLQCGGNNNNKTSSGDRMPLLENEIDNETKASNDDDYDSANVRNQENFSKAINAASRLNLDTNTIKNTSTDERDDAAEEIYGDYFDGEENFDEKDIMSMPVWTRPTLFSYLNLDWQNEFESYDGHETANSDDNYFIFDKSIAIDKSEWTKPSHGQYAKISMIISREKLVNLFGPSAGAEAANGDHLSPTNTKWYRKLHRTKALQNPHQNADNNLGFVVIRQGEDRHGITSLAAYTMLNSLVYEPEKYFIVPSSRVVDKPIVWDILHYAQVTRELIAYLEHTLPGLFFVTHYDVPGITLEDDDSELLYFMRSTCVHPYLFPFSNIPTSTEGNDEKSADVPTSMSSSDKRSNLIGNGALLGIDINALSKTIALVEEAAVESSVERDDGEKDIDHDNDDEPLVTFPYDLATSMKPLKERLRHLYYEYGNNRLEELALHYDLVYRASILRNDQIENASQYDGDGADDREDEHADVNRRHSSYRNELNAIYQDVRVKIVDLGNACWTYKHFTNDIQTRQYRCPEVILGANYDTSADMWSLGCIVFELLTGDLLFEPHAGRNWDREEDHLAMMIELLGPFPKTVWDVGKFADQYFNRKGELRHIHQLKFWGLEDVLHDKYKFDKQTSREIADFIMPLLEIDPSKRVTAAECFRHPWLAYDNNDHDRQYILPPIEESEYQAKLKYSDDTNLTEAENHQDNIGHESHQDDLIRHEKTSKINHEEKIKKIQQSLSKSISPLISTRKKNGNYSRSNQDDIDSSL